jgi:hypothetical protein
MPSYAGPMRTLAVCAFLALAGACASIAFAGAAKQSPAQRAVERVVLRAAQVGPGSITREIPQGRELAGISTLDLCGARFASEKMRVARVQLSWIRNTGGAPFLSNEVVAYKPGGAAQAMRELRAAIKACPKGFVKSTIPGAGMIKNQFDPIKGRDFVENSIGVIDHITEKVSKKKTLKFDSLLVYQVRGNVLSAVYAFGIPSLALVVHTATESAKNLKKLKL